MATMQMPARDLGIHIPKLSDEANAALERELLAVLDDDRPGGAEQQPSGTPAHRMADGLLARPHHRMFAAAVDIRIMVVPISLMFAVIALIPLGSTGVGFVAIPFAALVIGVSLVAELIASMTREVEHVSPETAALLANEGIGDPDRLFGDLLAEQRSTH